MKSRGLSLKKTESNIEIFKPGAKFDYLGFRFIHTNIKHKAIDNGKYTKFRWHDPFLSLRGHQNARVRSGLLILVRPKSYQKIKSDIRKLLSPKICPLPVSLIIDKINKWLRGIVNYYGLTKSTRYQLKILDYFIYKRLGKILLRKFGSKPGVRSFIRRRFIKGAGSKSTYSAENKDLLLTTEIQPYGNRPLGSLCFKPSRFLYNIYLDSEKILELTDDKIKLISQQKLLFGREFSLPEFRLLLLIAQKRVCTLCHTKITASQIEKTSAIQIDHNPRIHTIKVEL
jgi:hypothetical protein